MTYTTSVNIEIGIDDNFQYIVTPNVQRVLGDIVSSIQVGVHSFSIIGTYGIGKSTFLIALEEGLQHNSKKLLTNRTVFFGLDKFNIVNVSNPRSVQFAYDLLVSQLSYRTSHTKINSFFRLFSTKLFML